MVWVCGMLLLLAGVALFLYRRCEPPAVSDEEDAVRWERCRRAAQMNNFWTYDGTVQTDAEELAERLYHKGKGTDA